MSKLSQDEINRLANESDSDDGGEKEKAADYHDEFEKQPEEIEDNFEEDIEEEAKQSPLDAGSEVRSEIEEDNIDEIADEIISEEGSRDNKFKDDEDLSLAKSEFVQSSQLNIDSNLKQKKEQILKKISKDKVQAAKNPKKESKAPSKARERPLKPSKQQSNSKPDADQKKKQKLSQSQIKQRMRVIQQQRQKIQKKKQEKQKKEEDVRRKQYEEAKKMEEERKQKNRKILEEQNKKKKGGGGPVGGKSEIKISSEQVKLPQKRAEYTYMNMAKQRKNMQKNIQKQIESQNKNKLKKILEKPQSELKGQAKKAAFIEQRKDLRERQKKMRQMQAKQEDVLIVRQLKKEINQCRKFNIEKNEQINRTEKTIADLSKKMKEIEKEYYEKYTNETAEENPIQISSFSELSPIQKFVCCFPEAKTSEQIFRLIDANGDEVLSSQQLKQKLQQYHLQPEVIKKVEDLLDQNSDGTVSLQEFVFFVDREVKRQKDYRQIMGAIEMSDPLDLQAKIVDMQAKIRFINDKIDKSSKNKHSDIFQQKLDKLQKKAKKLQQQWKKDIQNANENDPSKNIGVNTTANLANEVVKLRNEKNMKAALLNKLRTRARQNLAEKNKLLAGRVEQNLRLSQEIFNIKNKIQESELRYLSMKKIHENKKGYLERQSQKQKEMEEAYKKTKQYKIAIADPSKKAQNAAERDEMRLLAAVLMIQRNYRKKKARGEVQKLKAERG